MALAIQLHVQFSQQNNSTGNHLTLHSPCNLQQKIDMLNKNTPGVQKVRPSRKHQLAQSYSYIQLKSVIFDGGQGLGCLLKYHIAINVYHLLPL